MSKSAIKKAIVLLINDKEFDFNPTVADHNNYTNEVTLDNKVAPAYAFLRRTVAPAHKEELLELLDTVPGLTMELFMEVSKGAKNGIKVSLKN